MRKSVVPLLLILIALITIYCDSESPAQTDPTTSSGQDAARTLAQVHCASCHLFPEPDELDRSTWANYVLPHMGYMLGVYGDMDRDSLLEPGIAGQLVDKAGVYPDSARLDSVSWATIKDYYLSAAPEKLPVIQRPALLPQHPRFVTRRPAYQLSPPSTTMLRIDDNGQLFVGDANSEAMYVFDETLSLQRAARTREGAVDLEDLEDRLLVTIMGSFSPTDEPKGLILELPLKAGGRPRILLENLQRPVHTTTGDLDNDGRMDLVISEFAKWTGRLAWWQQQPNGTFRPRILRDTPGAITSEIRDLNGDGLLDIIALFGQGDEGISAFMNEGGRFREKKLLRFPATWGSSSMQLYDIDQDGDEDILYTNGDNADYPPVLKPYHGIRIFEQTAPLTYEESWFYPLPGAYDVVPLDIEGDGDLDLAAISFFPDFQKKPEEGFVLLENNGNQNYTAYSFPEVELGRWIRLAAGDLDQDGDTDLALGSLAFEVVPPMGLLQEWVRNGVPFVVLENRGAKH